jgi:hypothetical protein
MKKYHSPKIEIEEIEATDIVLASGYGQNETPAVGGGNSGGPRPRSSGTIAGGSTVSNIANNSGASNAFSAGDIFGLR